MLVLTIRHTSPSGRLTGSLLLAVTLAPACGGQVGEDATASGFVGTGGQKVGSGGGSDATQIVLATGGQPTGFGGASAGGNVGGTGGSTDAGSPQDASICSGDPNWKNELREPASTADMVDCAIPVSLTVPGNEINEAVVNCTEVYGPSPSSDGWTIDDTTDPARLVFGAALCEQVKAQGQVPVYLCWIHTTIN